MAPPGTDDSDRNPNEEILRGVAGGLILVAIIAAYACGALAVLGLLWFAFSRLVL